MESVIAAAAGVSSAAVAAAAARPSVCLTMIVKNESAVIERALLSALPFIDSYAISDTGSTDDTKEIIKRVMDAAGKRGIIQDDAWVSFGHNRSLALKAAREQEPDGWSLMMDADDSMAGDAPPTAFWTTVPESLNAFRVNIVHGALRHHRTQIFSNRHLWKYDGAVHEFPVCITGEAIGHFPETAWIIARCEGARSQDPLKYVRDAFALRKELETKPTDPRTLFYLAQSFRDAGLTQESIASYKARAAVEGWAQERYMSYVNLIKMTDDIDEKLDYAWKAVEIDHVRLEAPYYVLMAARKQNKFSQKVVALGLLSTCREVSHGFLFAERHIYDYAFDDELSIISFWKGHPKISYATSLRARQKAPAHEWERINMNIKFAREKLGLPAPAEKIVVTNKEDAETTKAT
jgi:glycosyltransferase involved in cell wall biosynthesis